MPETYIPLHVHMHTHPRTRISSHIPHTQEDGVFDGFDAEEFTSRSGGKAEAVRHIKVGGWVWVWVLAGVAC